MYYGDESSLLLQNGKCKNSESEGTCSSEDEDFQTHNGIIDVEDLGKAMKKVEEQGNETRDMVTPQLRDTLSKQGYKIIGSHSGVKLCRWTKVKRF